MSFKDAFGKAKGKKFPFPVDGMEGEGQEPAEGKEESPKEGKGKKGGFAQAAKNAKKKKSKK